ncbi:MAG: class I tRNA ligase family protein [Thermoplasmata archaeon]|nr:class I tRNA ligase family protein [Thermoplasmata archaeon]
MASLPLRMPARSLEDEVNTLWQRRGLPNSLMPSAVGAPPPTYLLGVRSFRVGEPDGERLQRLLLADVVARYLRRAGREVREPVHGAPSLDSREATGTQLRALGAWFGRGDLLDPDPAVAASTLASIFERLAHEGLVRSRSAPFRFCTVCRELVPPSHTVYRERSRPEYIVRFSVAERSPPLSLLVSVDAAWKLLGTVAAVLHPDRPYVRLELHRRGVVEEVLAARHCLELLPRAWPGATWGILEERPGSGWTGLRFTHPLATEAPSLGFSPTTVGRVITSPLVAERSTGIVPLVPAHGPEDAVLARESQLAGIEVVGAEGSVLPEPRSLYSGLPVDTAEAFISRDLAADHSLASEWTVRRGVPHCAQCGTELIWRIAQAWTVDLERCPTEMFDAIRYAVPDAKIPQSDSPVPWPVTRAGTSSDPGDPELLECPACGRLAARSAVGQPCQCGRGLPVLVRRAPLPEIASRWGVWGRIAPEIGDSRLLVLVPARRRAAVLLEHMLGARATGVPFGRLRALVVAPPSPGSLGSPVDDETPIDAFRAELIRSTESHRRHRSRAHGVREASLRLHRFWRFAARVQRRLKAHGFAKDPRALAASMEDLQAEDHAFLVRYFHFRGAMQAAAERADWALVWDRWYSFFLRDLLSEYSRYMMAPRLARQAAGSRESSDAVLDIVVPGLAEMIAPVAPFVAEGIWSAFHAGGSSLFEESNVPRVVPRTHRSDVAYESCLELSRIAEGARQRYGLPVESSIPRLVLIARGDADADRLRPHLDMIARVTGAEDVEIHSPQRPWSGRTIEVHLRGEEIRRTYPTQAARIQSILAGMEPRRLRDAFVAGRLAITVLGSASMPITPAMVEVRELLPEGYVALSWLLGEICLELPKGIAAPAPLTLHWSHDVENVRVDLARRLAVSAAVERPPDVAYVAAPEALRAELESQAAALARELGIREIHVTPSHDQFAPRETTYGRTSREGRWWLWIPGNQVERRATRTKAPRPRLPSRRPDTTVDLAGIDEAADAYIARGEGVRSLVAQFDQAGIPPVVGPAKMGVAWDAGWKSVDAFARGELPALAALQGFGPDVARAIIGNLAPERDLTPLTPPRPIRWVPPVPEPSQAGPSDPSSEAVSLLLQAPVDDELPTGPDVATASLPEPALALSGAADTPALAPSSELPAPTPEISLESPPVDSTASAAPLEAAVPAVMEESTPAPEPAHGLPDPALNITPEPPSVESPTPVTPLETAAPAIMDESTAAAEPTLGLPDPAPAEGDLPETATSTSVGSPAPGPASELSPPLSAPTVTASLALDAGSPEIALPEPAPGVELLPAAVVPMAGPEGPLPPVESMAEPEGLPAPAESITEPEMLPAPPPSEVMAPSAEVDPRVSEAPVEPAVEPGPEPVAVIEAPEAPEFAPLAENSTSPSQERPPPEAVASAISPAEPPAFGLPSPVSVPPPSVREEPQAAYPVSPPIEPAVELGLPTEGTPELVPIGAPLPPPEAESLPPSPETTPGFTPPAPEETFPDPLPVLEPSAQAVVPISPSETPSEWAPTTTENPEESTVPSIPERPELQPLPELPTESLQTPMSGDSAPPNLFEVPVPERPAPVPGVAAPNESPVPERPTSGVLIATGPARLEVWGQFLEALSAGTAGLWIGRLFPKEIQGAGGGGPGLRSIFLTTTDKPDAIRPSNLPALAAAIKRAIEEEHVGVIVIEEVEYLVVRNGSDSVLALLDQVNTLAKENGARVWMPLMPELMHADVAEKFTAQFPAQN